MSSLSLFVWMALVSSNMALVAPISSDDIRVIDGDTIRVFHKAPAVRLVGFNAPETRRAQCEAERELQHVPTGVNRDSQRASKERV